MLHTLLLLLLSSCCPADSCHDDQGRPGIMVSINNCREGATTCSSAGSFGCQLIELEPRAVGSTWECDAGYELVGARVTWPGGVMATRPDKCTPVGGRMVHGGGGLFGGLFVEGQGSVSLASGSSIVLP